MKRIICIYAQVLIPTILLCNMALSQRCNGSGPRVRKYGYKGVLLSDGSLCIDSLGTRLIPPRVRGNLPTFEYPAGTGLINKAKEIVIEIDKDLKNLEEFGRKPENKPFVQSTLYFADAIKQTKQEIKAYTKPIEQPPLPVVPSERNRKIEAIKAFYFTKKNKYFEIVEFYKLHRRDRVDDMPLIPAPPSTDYNCWNCKGDKQTEFEVAKATYNCEYAKLPDLKQIVEYNKLLLEMGRYYELNNDVPADDIFSSNDPEYAKFREFWGPLNVDKVSMLMDRFEMILQKAVKNYRQPGQATILIPKVLDVERTKQLLGISGGGQESVLAEIVPLILRDRDFLLDRLRNKNDYFSVCAIPTLFGMERVCQLADGSRGENRLVEIINLYQKNRLQLTIDAEAKIETEDSYALFKTQIKAYEVAIVPQFDESEEQQRDSIEVQCDDTLVLKIPKQKNAKLVLLVIDNVDNGGAFGKVLNGEMFQKGEAKDGHGRGVFKSPISFKPLVSFSDLKGEECENDIIIDTISIDKMGPRGNEIWTGINYPLPEQINTLSLACFQVYQKKETMENIERRISKDIKKQLDYIKEKAHIGYEQNGDMKGLQEILQKTKELQNNIAKNVSVNTYSFPLEFKNKTATPINKRINVNELSPIPNVVYGYINFKLEKIQGRRVINN